MLSDRLKLIKVITHGIFGLVIIILYLFAFIVVAHENRFNKTIPKTYYLSVIKVTRGAPIWLRKYVYIYIRTLLTSFQFIPSVVHVDRNIIIDNNFGIIIIHTVAIRIVDR